MASSSLFSHPSPSSETSPFSFLPTSPTTLFLTTSAVVLGSWLYIWHLQPWVKLKEMSPKEKISDKLYNLCHSPDSISSEYAKDPSSTPSKISSHLYHQHIDAVHQSQPPKERVPASDEELQRAYECGNFGDAKPSELFLRVWYDALKTVEGDPMVGCVSPSLMGASGVCPLTVVGSIMDICLHMANLIVRADREVFLATNFWMNSDSSQRVHMLTAHMSRGVLDDENTAVSRQICASGCIAGSPTN
jgi:hypothetical protein